MELVIKHPNLPLRAYPDIDAELLKIDAWLSVLLNLKAAEGFDELVIKQALDGVKEHCRSMSLTQVKKAFEMYVDGSLGMTPRTNYLDRPLVGQIMTKFKETKHYQPVKQQQPEPDKKTVDKHKVYNAYESWRKFNYVIPGFAYVYDILDEYKLISYTGQQKRDFYSRAKDELVKIQSKGKSELEQVSIRNELSSPKNLEVIRKSKQMILDEVFREQNIEELINIIK